MTGRAWALPLLPIEPARPVAVAAPPGTLNTEQLSVARVLVALHWRPDEAARYFAPVEPGAAANWDWKTLEQAIMAAPVTSVARKLADRIDAQ